MRSTIKILAATALLICSCSGKPDGTFLVKGKVCDATTGKALSGVVVSDGIHCVRTNSGGKYRISAEPGHSLNAFVITPAEYEIEFDQRGCFCGYMPLDSTRTNICNFSLKPRSGDIYNYRMLMMGDPQVMTVRPHSVTAWSWTTSRLREYAESYNGELYQILLGDMVVNEIEVEGKAQSYLDTLAKTGIRTFHVPGNHDHDRTANSEMKSMFKYSEFFGPFNYAQNIGSYHYIFFDSFIWESMQDHYEGITDDAIRFIREDLANVPVETPLMLCTHCPFTKTYGGRFHEEFQNYDELMKLLEGRKADFWYGHIHFNSSYTYTQEELDTYAPGVGYIGSHIVGRPCGSWACSGEIGRDGSPRGMLELDIVKDSYSWHFHSLDKSYPDDFNILLPGHFKGEGIADDDAVYCNIYFWDSSWTEPELWIDGAKAGTLELCTSENYPSCADPLYAHFFPIWKSLGIEGFRNSEYPRDYDNNHLFKIVPPKGKHEAEIRFKDGWGREYCRTFNY